MRLFITRCSYVGLHLIQNSSIHGCNEKHNYDGKLVPWVLLVPLPSLSILFSSYGKYSCTADALLVSVSQVSAFILYSYTSSYLPHCASLMIFLRHHRHASIRMVRSKSPVQLCPEVSVCGHCRDERYGRT